MYLDIDTLFRLVNTKDFSKWDNLERQFTVACTVAKDPFEAAVKFLAEIKNHDGPPCDRDRAKGEFCLKIANLVGTLVAASHPQHHLHCLETLTQPFFDPKTPQYPAHFNIPHAVVLGLITAPQTKFSDSPSSTGMPNVGSYRRLLPEKVVEIAETQVWLRADSNRGSSRFPTVSAYRLSSQIDDKSKVRHEISTRLSQFLRNCQPLTYNRLAVSEKMRRRLQAHAEKLVADYRPPTDGHESPEPTGLIWSMVGDEIVKAIIHSITAQYDTTALLKFKAPEIKC